MSVAAAIDSETAPQKPLPHPSPLTQPFWDALKRNELHLQRCTECGNYNHPPKIVCPKCHSEKIEWTRVADTGKLYSYTIVHRPPVPAFKGDVPYPVGLVDVDGTNVRLLTSLLVPIEKLKIGMPLKVVFDPVRNDFSLFRYTSA